MHHAFTGNTRRARQVNLSGRPSSNPWANVPGSTKSSHGQLGAQNTLAQAVAERQRRQHERDRMIASRKVQKTWRGHESRRKQKAKWRQEWDDNEQQRLHGTHDVSYHNVLDQAFIAPAYASPESLLSQLRLLNHFQEYRRQLVRHELDTARLLFFSNALCRSLSVLTSVELDTRWQQNLAKLGVTAAKHIRSINAMGTNAKTNEATRQLAVVITYLVNFVPQQMAQNARLYMEVLREICIAQAASAMRDAGLTTLTTLLQQKDRHIYFAFADVMLSDETLSKNLGLLKALSSAIDYSVLARALNTYRSAASTGPDGDKSENLRLLWQLSYLITLDRVAESKQEDDSLNFIVALTSLLKSCSDIIIQHLQEPAISQSIKTENSTVPPFISESIATICRQEFIQDAISMLSSTSRVDSVVNGDHDFQVADRLAGYALSMMSNFETRKPLIRQYLYQSSIGLPGGQMVSTIRYFWDIVMETKVFQQIKKDDRRALSVLTEAPPHDQQIGRPLPNNQQFLRWRSEWRITLTFLELYNFALKLMDDEDFFSIDEVQKVKRSADVAEQWRKGALPLAEVANLVTFLKHLAFSLYWNAARLVRTDEADPENLAVLLGSATHDRQAAERNEKSAPVKLAGNEVTHPYLKDLTTALLRMLHDRDSRRNFLPSNHFLMSDQVDLTGFIADVVTEEEKRYEMHDEDSEIMESLEVDDVTIEPDLESGEMLAAMFGIRQPHAPRSYASQQAAKREQQKLRARKNRQIQLLAPRLEILRNLPFFIPFEMRVQIFRGFIHKDQLRRRDGFVDPDNWRMHIASTTQGRDLEGRPRGFDIIGRHHAEIHRESVFADAYDAYYPLGDGLKEPIQISFIDKFGAPEAGIDGGGVTKEFLMSVTSEALEPHGHRAMFTENEQRFLYPNPLIAEETSQHLKALGMKERSEAFNYNMLEVFRRYEFLGRIIGKCLYEGILIDVNFAGFFLLKWALTGGTTSASIESQYRASINDLRDYDGALYQGLLKLKNYSGDVEADFGLNFTVSDEISLTDSRGREITKSITRDLIPNGSNIAVTNTNRYMYIDRIVRYRLVVQPRAVTDAFLKGLGQIIQPMWLAMFNQKELQKLVGGDNSELDIADLRRNTQYGGLYVIGDDGLEHPTVELFWKVLKDMDDADRRKVLKFVTSTPRAPLLGFSHLNPKFSIRDSSEDQDRLPSTSTCVNLLKLPRYGDIRTMREKLLYAVNSGAGFDLS